MREMKGGDSATMKCDLRKTYSKEGNKSKETEAAGQE